MKNNIILNLKIGIISTTFSYCLFAIVLYIYLCSFEQILTIIRSGSSVPSGFHADIILSAITSDSFSFIVPIISALPMAGSYIEEIKSNFVRYSIHRSSRSSYIIGKFFGTAFTGALVILFGILCTYMISFLIFCPIESKTSNTISYSQEVRTLLEVLPTILLSAALWSTVGLMFSSFMESKYIAYSSPFIIFYILIILYERFFLSFYVISPKEWLVPSEKWHLGELGTAVVITETLFVVALLFYINASRRLKEI